jgi:hypothetical protein
MAAHFLPKTLLGRAGGNAHPDVLRRQRFEHSQNARHQRGSWPVLFDNFFKAGPVLLRRLMKVADN